ncbi:SMI1/KNR4 family protein [Croceimicrobium sp.]|uniref:SMI1/KNR4 family protein n=1 Tax=Croceimicrobium sp. TaxID=2828340 RepID=UPI003BA859E8
MKHKIDLQKLDAAATELGIKLPDFLRTFYEERSDLIKRFKELSRDEDHITLSTDFDWILSYNRDFLQLPKTEGPCKNKICIGTDGCGNDSFIILEDPDKRVFKLDHEIANELIDPDTGDFDWEDERMEKYASLEDYLREEIKFLEEFRNSNGYILKK